MTDQETQQIGLGLISETSTRPDSGSIEKSDTTDSDKDCDCDELPAGWPCADCFINGEADFKGEYA